MADTRLALTFDRSLYHPEGVAAAVEAYSGYAASIDVEEGPEAITVALVGFDPGYGDLIGDSFANHALFETIVRAREVVAGVAV